MPDGMAKPVVARPPDLLLTSWIPAFAGMTVALVGLARACRENAKPTG